MELAISAISLMWVIGLFSLQRIDGQINEYYSGLKYYLSLSKDGVVQKEQLDVISLLPRSGIDNYIDVLIKSKLRDHSGFLRKAKRVIRRSKMLKRIIETLLLAITIYTPVVYYADFSSLHLPEGLNKGAALYIALVVVAFSSLVIESVIDQLLDKNAPVRMKHTEK